MENSYQLHNCKFANPQTANPRIVRDQCIATTFLMKSQILLITRCSQVHLSLYSTSQEDQKASETTASNNNQKEAEKIAEDTISEQKSVSVEELEKAFHGEKDKLQAEKAELEDKYKRALAETQNVRQRMQRQIDDVKLFGIQSFCKNLLEVADILNKATESVPQEELNERNPHLKNLYDGLKMTDEQLHKVFTNNGLLKVHPTIGEKFDPNIHEAMFQQTTESVSPGCIAVVVKGGYTLHNRILRPVVVGVAKEP